MPKGASTITKGFTCSLECERVKFVFLKELEKPFSILSGTQQRRTLCRCAVNIKFLQYSFLVRSGVGYYAVASLFSHLRVRSSEVLYAAA